jgi:catechol 2,3-dioxygenase-like lactoylglutathione lyase family enzyme
LTVADPPEAWRDAGYTVDDDGGCRLGQVRLHLVGREHGKGIRSWGLRGVSVTDDPFEMVDGIPTTVTTSDPASPALHPNGVVGIDHVVLTTPDLDRTTAALEAIGLSVRATRDSDTYGAPMRQVFFRLEDVILELIGRPGTARQGDRPARFFGIACNVEDLDATKAFFGERLGQPKDAVQPGRRIATLRHEPLGLSVATAFMSL